MTTDPPCAARIRIACPNAPEPDLVVLVQHRARAVIESELQRLARRVPSLDQADLDLINAALEDLAEALVIARLRNARQDAAPQIGRLFD